MSLAKAKKVARNRPNPSRSGAAPKANGGGDADMVGNLAGLMRNGGNDRKQAYENIKVGRRMRQ